MKKLKLRCTHKGGQFTRAAGDLGSTLPIRSHQLGCDQEEKVASLRLRGLGVALEPTGYAGAVSTAQGSLNQLSNIAIVKK